MHSTLTPPAPPPRPVAVRVRRRCRRVWRRLLWAGRLAVSAVVLVGVLSGIAAVPVANIYVLGYLLEAEGRVARGRRWRDTLPWVRYAPRLAAVAVGTLLCLLPTLLLADFARDAALIDPGGGTVRTLRVLTRLCGAATAIHLFLAWLRGGSLGSFVRPVKNVRHLLGLLRRRELAGDVGGRLAAGLRELAPLSRWWLGARGLAVAVFWLLIPCAMIAAAGPADAGRLLLKLAGILGLTAVFPLLLILQARFAADQRLRAGLDPRGVATLFGRAPLAWLAAGFLTAGLALPLFLFKIVAPPRDAIWLLTPLFVAAMLPARIATGWACRRSVAAMGRRRWVAVIAAAIGLVAVGLAYSAGVTVAQYVNEHGRRAVFEQHAFSLPVPF